MLISPAFGYTVSLLSVSLVQAGFLDLSTTLPSNATDQYV